MTQRTKLSIVIPAYNEENRILPTLESITDYFSNKKNLYEVIVVNDGSNDRTSFAVKKYSKIDPNVLLASYKKNRGKGYAVRHGMNLATGDYNLFIDADGAISIDHLDIFFKHMKEGHDLIIGSIELPGHIKEDHNQLYRRFLGKLAKFLIRFTATPGIYDTQRAFKLFTSHAARNIFELQTIQGWGFDIEILVIAKKFKYKIKEVPVIWINPDHSKVEGLWAYLNTLLELVKIVTRSSLGYYRPKQDYHFSDVKSSIKGVREDMN
jgi:dolichyl-phosphate beta-glucosyltransferase